MENTQHQNFKRLTKKSLIKLLVVLRISFSIKRFLVVLIVSSKPHHKDTISPTVGHLSELKMTNTKSTILPIHAFHFMLLMVLIKRS